MQYVHYMHIGTIARPHHYYDRVSAKYDSIARWRLHLVWLGSCESGLLSLDLNIMFPLDMCFIGHFICILFKNVPHISHYLVIVRIDSSLKCAKYLH